MRRIAPVIGLPTEHTAQDEAQRRRTVCSPMQRPVVARHGDEWWHELPQIFHTC